MTPENDNAAFDRLLDRSERISIRSLTRILASRWYWITATTLLSGLCGYFYLKAASPHYEASANLKFQEKHSELDDLKAKSATLMFWRSPKDYLVEKYQVNSPELLQKTLKQMDVPFSFYRIKDLRKIDVYPFRPVLLTVANHDDKLYKDGLFRLDEQHRLSYQDDKQTQHFDLEKSRVVEVEGLSFRIDSIVTAPGFFYEFVFAPSPGEHHQAVLTEVEENLPIMTLSFRSHNEHYARDFLRTLLATYHSHTLTQRQTSTDQNLQFIGHQKQVFADSLRLAAQELQRFKEVHQFHDIGSTASDLVLQLRQLDQNLQQIKLQNEAFQLVERAVDGEDPAVVEYLPLGLDQTSDAVLIKLIDQYNQRVARRHELQHQYTDEFPSIKALNQELKQLKVQISDNVNRQKAKNQRLEQQIANSEHLSRSRFSQLPGQERNFLYLKSKFDAHQSIYTLLLNKEMESAMAKSGILPAFTVLSDVKTKQLFPKASHVLAIFLFAGVCSGIALIFVKRALNTRFHSIAPTELWPTIPLGTVVPRLANSPSPTLETFVALTAHQNVFTESQNSLRTKLIFSGTNVKKEDGGKIVLITSQKSGEGKSFLTVNLALSFARIRKRVLLVGCDLRKPGVDAYLGAHTPGLSEWLQGESTCLDSHLRPTPLEGIDYLPSGAPPLLPGELLQQQKLSDALDDLRKTYDFVLIDTAPVGLVADNTPLLAKAQHILFVVRWLYSDANAPDLAEQLAAEHTLSDIKLVINGYYNDPLYHSMLTTSAKKSPNSDAYYSHYFKNGQAYFR
jgi:tyrosine-protein kinase Etk/Wzc